VGRDQVYALVGLEDQVLDRGVAQLLGDGVPLVLEHRRDVRPVVLGGDLALDRPPATEVFDQVALLAGEIDQQHVLAAFGERDPEVGRGGRLPGAALVEERAGADGPRHDLRLRKRKHRT